MFHEKTSEAPISKHQADLEKLLPSYCKRLKRKGVTREMLHKEYLGLHPDGYVHGADASLCVKNPRNLNLKTKNYR